MYQFAKAIKPEEIILEYSSKEVEEINSIIVKVNNILQEKYNIENKTVRIFSSVLGNDSKVRSKVFEIFTNAGWKISYSQGYTLEFKLAYAYGHSLESINVSYDFIGK